MHSANTLIKGVDSLNSAQVNGRLSRAMLDSDLAVLPIISSRMHIPN